MHEREGGDDHQDVEEEGTAEAPAPAHHEAGLQDLELLGGEEPDRRRAGGGAGPRRERRRRARAQPRQVVTASDRRGLLRDIGDALAREKINVTAVRTQSRDDLAFMRFSFDVSNMVQLKRALAQVREVKGVIRVARG